MIDNFAEVLNFSRLFSNSTGSYVNSGQFSPLVASFLPLSKVGVANAIM